MYGDIFQNIDLINRGIEVTWMRNEVISNNIANVDTPGFKSSEVEFEHLFSEALDGILGRDGGELRTTDDMHIESGRFLATTHGRHIEIGSGLETEPYVYTDTEHSIRYDENNVDIEHEMAELAKNTIEYYTLINKVNSEFAKLTTAINVT